jgi:hypothetical protein
MNMDADEKKVLQRLLKKLTALRMTLSGEERDLLDKLVVSDESDEVAAHSLSTGMAKPKTFPVSQPKYDPKLKEGDESEVEAHSLSTGMAKPKTFPVSQPKYDPKLKEGDEDEVEAHMRFKIELDPDGRYSVGS